MSNGIAGVLTFAVGVAVSPVPIIAVILMMFSRRAKVNGPVFLLGWVLALTVVGGVAYVLADQGGVATSTTAADSVASGKLVLGIVLLVLAARRWRNRPGPDEEPELPTWMAGVDDLQPPKAFALGVLLAGVNPKNLILTLGASTALAELGPTTAEAIVALAVFVVVASATIAVPVLYRLVAGDAAAARLDSLEQWLRVHNSAVMMVLLIVFGVDLIAKALPPIAG